MAKEVTVRIGSEFLATVFVTANAEWWQRVTIRGSVDRIGETDHNTHGRPKQILRELVAGPAALVVSAEHSKDNGETWQASDGKQKDSNENRILVGFEDRDHPRGDYNDVEVLISLGPNKK